MAPKRAAITPFASTSTKKSKDSNTNAVTTQQLSIFQLDAGLVHDYCLSLTTGVAPPHLTSNNQNLTPITKDCSPIDHLFTPASDHGFGECKVLITRVKVKSGNGIKETVNGAGQNDSPR